MLVRKTMEALKPLTYATRRLVAGDTFEAGANDAKVLSAIGKAKIIGDATIITPVIKEPVVEPILGESPLGDGLGLSGAGSTIGSVIPEGGIIGEGPITGSILPEGGILDDDEPDTEELTALRIAYREKFNKQAYYGWDADTLRAKLAE